MSRLEQRIIALGYFKDWSNFLLVTTVAILGWTASPNSDLASPWDVICIWLFAFSVVLGIFTLALIPVVTEDLAEDAESFYYEKGSFHLWPWKGGSYHIRIKWFCWPQHASFLIGIVCFAIGATISP
jgi:hypothetical protein